MIPEGPITVTVAPGVALEAAVALPAPAGAGAVLCHPHPLYGGDMDNPVVLRMAQACAREGLATLRFNFRGVGASTGAHDEGRGERDDVRAALGHLKRLLPPGSALALAGYSFGAAVAAAVAAAGERLAGLALVAPPLAYPGFARLLPLPAVSGPVLVVAGSRDEHCPAPALERLRAAWPFATVTLLEGADHFFAGGAAPLGEALTAWARGIREAAG